MKEFRIKIKSFHRKKKKREITVFTFIHNKNSHGIYYNSNITRLPHGAHGAIIVLETKKALPESCVSTESYTSRIVHVTKRHIGTDGREGENLEVIFLVCSNISSL